MIAIYWIQSVSETTVVGFTFSFVSVKNTTVYTLDPAADADIQLL
jgi:hypothetical protein